MTKEPADWAKIKAYRVEYPNCSLNTDDDIVRFWAHGVRESTRELARMYDQYEKPPVDPDLLAAREWGASLGSSLDKGYHCGKYDDDLEIKGFLAGIKHGRANP